MCSKPEVWTNFFIFASNELGTIVCETMQWYTMAVELGLGKVNDGSGLSVDQLGPTHRNRCSGPL